MNAPAGRQVDWPMVGRDREFDELRERLRRLNHGQGGFVLVGGEAGIGKTTLIGALGREARASDVRVLAGHCYDHRSTPPYGPWIGLIGDFETDDSSPVPPPILSDETARSSVDSQDALFADVSGFLSRLAAQRPLVIILEDLHWSDPASLDLLRFLVRRLNREPILIVGSYRDDDLTRGHPLSGALPTLVREGSGVPYDAATAATCVHACDCRPAVSPADRRRRTAFHLPSRPFGREPVLHTRAAPRLRGNVGTREIGGRMGVGRSSPSPGPVSYSARHRRSPESTQ